MIESFGERLGRNIREKPWALALILIAFFALLGLLIFICCRKKQILKEPDMKANYQQNEKDQTVIFV